MLYASRAPWSVSRHAGGGLGEGGGEGEGDGTTAAPPPQAQHIVAPEKYDVSQVYDLEHQQLEPEQLSALLV